MKKIYLICLLTFISHLAIAQNKITGKITDEKTGEAIAGATVYIPELKTGAFADKNGEYKIEIVKGPVSLTFGSDALAGEVNLLPAPPVVLTKA